ncbi:Type IV secretion system protein virB3 [Caballeronia terrestris]|uniref:Type IV secretion system protein virB3 n=1 Tax=Caballeronia terrestris TaxID=1226301 RepID=A0A158KBU9_9BURK|nr:VirB3 family type IV secretion system protein [Caballeronia terrestris]SAL78515.1 Type IV secretion system protein virB3 [Caballeronia terrestris]
MKAGEFPLFKGATRLPTYAGIPRTPFLLIFMVCGALFMLIHFWTFLLFVLLWFVCFCITKHDDRMFRIIGLAFRTKVVNRIDSPFTKRWGGSSHSTVNYQVKK